MRVKNDTLRKAFRQCEMLRGDAEGAKGRCELFTAGTVYVDGQQLRVCDYHLKLVRQIARDRKILEEASAKRSRETPGRVVLTDA